MKKKTNPNPETSRLQAFKPQTRKPTELITKFFPQFSKDFIMSYELTKPCNRSSRSSRRKISIDFSESHGLPNADDASKTDLAVQKASVGMLLSFVPSILVEQILAEPWDPAVRMPCHNIWGATSFIDISGFSSLASELQRKDDEARTTHKSKISGAESLTIFLNNTLRLLIDVVADFGGDIVKVICRLNHCVFCLTNFLIALAN